MWKTSSVFLAAAIAMSASAMERAEAASCASLQSQLSALSGGGGSKLSSTRQRLARLQRQASANGCNNSSSLGKPRACAGIESQIRTVSGQIAQLESRGGGGDAASRKRIQAQMAKQRCGQEAPAPQRQAQQPSTPPPGGAGRNGDRPEYVVQNNRIVSTKRTQGGLFSLLFGAGPKAEAVARDDSPEATLSSLQSDRKSASRSSDREIVDGDGKVHYARHFFGGGSYRTLCVRSCDGYYFPISTVTTRGSFARDEAVCQSLCPNTEAALYAHTAGSESENMYRVTDGRSYKELDTAFVYRKAYDPACTCAFEAKMIVSADGKELIDVAGSRAAYSPAIITDAASAIEGMAPPGDGIATAPQPVIAEASPTAEEETVATPAVATPAVADPSAASVVVTEISSGPVTPAAVSAVETPSETSATDDAEEPAVVVQAAPAATAPRGAPIPDGTLEPLRVRTIGPEFLQDR